MATHKRQRRKYRIEETFGDKPSESALIVVHPFADLGDISDCAREMYTPDLKRLHVVFDKRIPTRHIQTYLADIMEAMPNLEYTVKFTDPRTIELIRYLWNEMCDYSAKRSNLRNEPNRST